MKGKSQLWTFNALQSGSIIPAPVYSSNKWSGSSVLFERVPIDSNPNELRTHLPDSNNREAREAREAREIWSHGQQVASISTTTAVECLNCYGTAGTELQTIGLLHSAEEGRTDSAEIFGCPSYGVSQCPDQTAIQFSSAS